MDRGKGHVVHHMTDEKFKAALKIIQKGEIPGNFPDVVAHVQGTIHEFMEFATAITECALRLNNSNEVLRDILEKSGVKYRKNHRRTVNGRNDQFDDHHHQ